MLAIIITIIIIMIIMFLRGFLDVLATLSCTLHILSHLNLRTILWKIYTHSFHFTYEKTKKQKG